LISGWSLYPFGGSERQGISDSWKVNHQLGGQAPVGRSTTKGKKMITGTFSMMQRVPMLDPWDPKHVILHAEKI